MHLKGKLRKKKSLDLQTQYSENEDNGIQSHHFMANRWENNGKFGAPKSMRTVTADTKDAFSLEEKL